MNFSYTYRKKDGALATGTIEAVDRKSALSELRGRGITPVNVWPSTAKEPGGAGPKLPVSFKAIGGVAAVAVLVVIGWLAFGPSTPAPRAKAPTPAAAKAPKEPVSHLVPRTAPVTNAVATKTEGTTDGVYKVVHGPFGEKRVKVRYSKAVLAALRSANSAPVQDLRAPERDPNAPPPPPPRYSNNLHIQLSEYAVSGKFVGVPDPMTDQEARRLIDEKVVINPDDPEDVVAEKMEVAKMQDELKAYMDEGGHANDYFMKLMERQDAEAETVREAKRQIRELVQSGDFDLADQTREKFNEYLKGKGLPALSMTAYMKHARAEALKKKDSKAK